VSWASLVANGLVSVPAWRERSNLARKCHHHHHNQDLNELYERLIRSRSIRRNGAVNIW